MSFPSIPNWCRILGWGLLASLVLHWVAFDLMRSAAWTSHGPSMPTLQVSLKEASGDPLHQPEVSVTAGASARPTVKPARQADVGRPAARLSSSVGAAQPAAAAVPTPFVQPAGVRSGRSAEAMVAMRLSIAESLIGLYGKSFSLPQAVLLMCDFDEGGHLVAVRDTSGTAQPGLPIMARRAIEQVVLPAALMGQAFSLDLLLEPGG
ncbi:hypothetical protein VVD49_14765 [Uliginosibacterium sp. H3]|uniref:TonB C-terminal domain-containing protein n=1 Tax=Uliginosibacterium silvisoli TaxID=3114758 RepID=A0ABU6K678_9RHOO|nr:hypothetical protein [Uliginosibacterium sp. H3]